jgi:hypothetical protein
MKVRKKPTMARMFTIVVAASVMVTAGATPALASTDDSFNAFTPNCGGEASFVDYGPGAPGGGNNDDYEFGDLCPDGHGVKAWAWIGSKLLGSKYDGEGSGPAIIWDPFPAGNVKAGDLVGLKICEVDGANGTPFNCGSAAHRSKDG